MASFGTTIPSDENRSEFAVLKAGPYHAEIISGDVKTSSTGGTYVEFTFRILEGEGAVGRQVRGRFNIINNNPEAARIGKQQLIQLADSVDIMDPSDTDPFIGKHCIINVTVRPAHDQYGESNEIKSYKRYDGAYTPSASPAPAAQASAPVQTAAKPKWLSK